MKYLLKYNEAKKIKLSGNELDSKCRELFERVKKMLNLDLDDLASDVKNILFDIVDEYDIHYDWKLLTRNNTIKIYPSSYSLSRILKEEEDEEEDESGDFFNFSNKYEDNFTVEDDDEEDDDDEEGGTEEDRKRRFYKNLTEIYNEISSMENKNILFEFYVHFDIHKKTMDFMFNSIDSTPRKYDKSYNRIVTPKENFGKLENDVFDLVPKFKSIGAEFTTDSFSYGDKKNPKSTLSFRIYFPVEISKEAKDWINIIPEDKRKPLLDFAKKTNLKVNDLQTLLNIIYK